MRHGRAARYAPRRSGRRASTQACRAGRQAYWVCPLIEESEALQCQAAEDTAAALAARLPELRIGLVHGRMPAGRQGRGDDARSRQGEARPAGRHHRDRGRRGRAQRQPDDRSRMPSAWGWRSCTSCAAGSAAAAATAVACCCTGRRFRHIARARLAVLRDTQRRFRGRRAATCELRGPGELLGTRQTGEQSLRVADLLRDQDLLNAARYAADRLLREQPDGVEPLIRRWIGVGARYEEV
ncbi:MAG: hypothetical protein MZV65_36385 [Chromatiales bacterium]|nr:hypothetical protein [Chromatiales bacterium]